MYERFTDRGRKVMQLANNEALRLNHQYIGTEHILLGLVNEGSGVGANVLKNLNIDLDKVRKEIDCIVQPGPEPVAGVRSPTPRAKRVIEYSIEEARNLDHNYVGTEHLLLGLLREEQGVAAQVLMNLGLTLEDARAEVLNMVGQAPEKEGRAKGSQSTFVSHRYTELAEWPDEVLQAMNGLDVQIAQLNQEKEAAVTDQDWERAARLRDQAEKLKKAKDDLARDSPGRNVVHIQEYDLFLPLRYKDGSHIEAEKLEIVRKRLIDRFGGVIELAQRLEDSWWFGKVTLRDELVIYRVFSPAAPSAFRSAFSVGADEIILYRDHPKEAIEDRLFLAHLKEELKADLKQDDIFILTRRVEAL